MFHEIFVGDRAVCIGLSVRVFIIITVSGATLKAQIFSLLLTLVQFERCLCRTAVRAYVFKMRGK